jgi:hypothetical protein
LDYCRLWRAIITLDEATLEAIAKKLNAPYHRVFASMITARSWDQLEQGKGKLDGKITAEDKERIKKIATQRVGDIVKSMCDGVEHSITRAHWHSPTWLDHNYWF